MLCPHHEINVVSYLDASQDIDTTLLFFFLSIEYVFVVDYDDEGQSLPKIFVASPETLDFEEVPLRSLRGPWAVTYDKERERLCWSDIIADAISCAKIDGSNQQVIVGNVPCKNQHTQLKVPTNVVPL